MTLFIAVFVMCAKDTDTLFVTPIPDGSSIVISKIENHVLFNAPHIKVNQLMIIIIMNFQYSKITVVTPHSCIKYWQ